MNKSAQLANLFQSIDNLRKKEFLNNLSIKEINILKQTPELFLRPDQIIKGNARYNMAMAGRSFGKTFMGGAWVATKVIEGAISIGIVAPTFSDLEQVMVPTILAWFGDDAKYVGGNKKTITFKKYPKATVYCYSSDMEIRGPNLWYLWADEMAKWCDSLPDKIEEQFKVLDFAVRAPKGHIAQILITSTPKPFPIFIRFEDRYLVGDENVNIRYGTLLDNTSLDVSFRDSMLAEYGKTRLGQQEIYGKLLRDVPGALWNYEMIDPYRVNLSTLQSKINEKITKVSETGHISYHKPTELLKIVTGVDPSVSDNSETCDETGIITAALLSDGHVYILEDSSGQYTTLEWAQKTVQAYEKWGGSVVIEKNNGGDLVKRNIQNICSTIPIRTVTAVKGKIDRAMPISALYEQGLVHHVMPDNKLVNNPFDSLEQQLTRFTGNPKEKSPGRLDSLVWAVFDLKLANISNVNRDFTAIGYY
jgi:phage terminase large subunit-like protein